MAELLKKVTEYLTGDREPGETAPKDDSHIKGLEVKPIVGDDGEPEPKIESEEEPETFAVEIAGVMRDVDKETYDMVMLERAENRAAQLAPRLEPEPEPEDGFDAEAFYTDPAAVLAEVKNQAVREATSLMGAKHAADKSQNDFWNAFYKENPKLVGEETTIKIILAENMTKLRSLSNDKTGRDQLAGLTEEYMLRIANKQRGRKKADDSTRLLDGNVTITTEDSDEQAQTNPDVRPPSIGDALKERKLKRDRAKRGESTQLS
jgi:hypothetical protein